MDFRTQSLLPALPPAVVTAVEPEECQSKPRAQGAKGLEPVRVRYSP
jgi:hypothetical protein